MGIEVRCVLIVMVFFFFFNFFLSSFSSEDAAHRMVWVEGAGNRGPYCHSGDDSACAPSLSKNNLVFIFHVAVACGGDETMLEVRLRRNTAKSNS